MKVLNQHIAPMYVWAIALLSIVAAVSAYTLQAVPYPLIAAVLFCSAIELLLNALYVKHKPRIPFSGIITGLIIGSVAPINAPLLLVLVASAIAVTSKLFLKYKSVNILNPAAIGLVVALALFGMGDSWWAAASYNVYGIALSITPVFIILAYMARRLTTAVSFVAISLAVTLALTGFGITQAIVAVLGFNYLFAFVMLVDPKTSPNNRYMQIAYVAAVVALYAVESYLRVPYPLLIALLIGNMVYLLYRSRGRR